MDTEKKLKLEKHSVYGYCFRVGRAEASVLRNKPEFIEYATQKAGTYFTTVKLKDINESWSTLCNEYEKCQSSLVKQIIDSVGKKKRKKKLLRKLSIKKFVYTPSPSLL